MTVWRSFGASVIGPSHLADGMLNQDAWVSFHRVWGDGVVVSDGLGSKPFSHLGSRAACLAAVHAIRSWCGDTSIDHAVIAERIKNKWISLLAPLQPADCAATCLFAVRMNCGVVHLAMLGDGLAAVVRGDGMVVSMSDDKSEGFSNITAALSPELTTSDWRWMSLPEEDCQSILLCTDGVADDLSDVYGFVKEFCQAHGALCSVSAARRIRQMLENWPTPGHTDDKTIACLVREKIGNE